MEGLIREVWRQRGQKLWNLTTHGLGQPLQVDGFIYRIEPRNIDGRDPACMVCEGVTVEVSP